jgi:hypothetical protein
MRGSIGGKQDHILAAVVIQWMPLSQNSREKMRRYAIDKFWLENHPECDKPTRIEDWKDDNESSGERQYGSEQSDNEGDQFDDDELYL